MITIDEFHFQVTLHPQFDGCCVLWVRDSRMKTPFDILGRFTRFNKRDVLFFVSRYSTSFELRREIEHRRFERKISGWTREVIADIERSSRQNAEVAFRRLFDLDAEIDPELLTRRRRIMARKFHPDKGGDSTAMSLINRAYAHLTEQIETV